MSVPQAHDVQRLVEAAPAPPAAELPGFPGGVGVVEAPLREAVEVGLADRGVTRNELAAAASDQKADSVSIGAGD